MSKFISQGEFDGHDCKLGEDSGCLVCVLFHEQRNEESVVVERSMNGLFGSEILA